VDAPLALVAVAVSHALLGAFHVSTRVRRDTHRAAACASAIGVYVLGLRPDILHGAGIPLAMEALHGFVEPGRAWRGPPEGLHNAVRHGEHRRHEDKQG